MLSAIISLGRKMRVSSNSGRKTWKAKISEKLKHEEGRQKSCDFFFTLGHSILKLHQESSREAKEKSAQKYHIMFDNLKMLKELKNTEDIVRRRAFGKHTMSSSTLPCSTYSAEGNMNSLWSKIQLFRVSPLINAKCPKIHKKIPNKQK